MVVYVNAPPPTHLIPRMQWPNHRPQSDFNSDGLEPEVRPRTFLGALNPSSMATSTSWFFY